METQLTRSTADTRSRGRIWLAVLLLGLGLLGHLLAAYDTGGRPIDYQHHVLGFVFLSLMSALIFAGLGWLFWRGRHGLTLLLVGVVQAVLGLIIYLERVSISVSW